MVSYVILLLGFVLLVKGADFFVEGASTVARKFNIPPLIIGLTIVAFGTSAPEAAVSITSALQGQNDMAIGNVVGSNIFNLLLVVGVAAAICPLQVKRSIIAKEFPFAMLSAFVLLVLAHDTTFQNHYANEISQADGIMLLVLFGIYMYYLLELALGNKSDEIEALAVEEGCSNGKNALITFGGLIGIVLGGQLVVSSATDIALSWGISESLVGLTIVAIGTSLPELVTSVIAARKGESDIALGNVIGSNIFNIFFVLGISAFISPIAVSGTVLVDMVTLLIISVLTYGLAVSKRSITKPEGIILVLMYGAYMFYIIQRG